MHWKIYAGVALAGLLLAAAPARASWQACAEIREDGARLACFDAWARQQQAPVVAAAPVPPVPPSIPDDDGCHNEGYTLLSRLWELEKATSCGIFGIRSYRPISLSLIASDSVNRLPRSGNPANTASTATSYRSTETRIQLSVRSKLAQGVFTKGELQDSFWFGYTQQSYWQLFTTGDLSRPFRNTDHEPELVYVHPFAQELAGGWKLRYGGLGLVHQSNGQSLPLSRSWNRVYLMAGAEHAGGLNLTGRVWRRIKEDAETDDNPEISDYVGRAEMTGAWSTGGGQLLAATWRTTLRRLDRGSLRLEWMVPVKSPFTGRHYGNLQWHTQLFTGYGDSLIDYNRKRTVLSVGLSLFDW